MGRSAYTQQLVNSRLTFQARKEVRPSHARMRRVPGGRKQTACKGGQRGRLTFPHPCRKIAKQVRLLTSPFSLGARWRDGCDERSDGKVVWKEAVSLPGLKRDQPSPFQTAPYRCMSSARRILLRIRQSRCAPACTGLR